MSMLLAWFNMLQKIIIIIQCFIRLPFKRQLHKMVKHTQTIPWLLPTNCLNVFDYFVLSDWHFKG